MAEEQEKQVRHQVDLESCSTEDTRPCDLSVSLRLAEIMADEMGIQVPQVKAILQAGRYTSEDAIKKALLEFVAVSPDDRRVESESVLCAVFPEEGPCKQE